MTDKLELKSSHEVIYTVDVADVESIFYCKPTDPDILTVLMKDGKRLYCDEVCPMQEKPINENLEDASKEWLRPKLDKSYANYGETKMMELTHFDGYNMLDAIEFGAEWQKNKNNTIVGKDLKQAADNALESITDQYDIISVGSCLEMFRLGSEWSKKHLWKDAQGDDLPEIDREVIVLCENSYAAYGHSPYVAFGHRPNPDGWDGKSLATGEVEHYTPKTYDKGGWNIPDVKYWLDVVLPKEMEE